MLRCSLPILSPTNLTRSPFWLTNCVVKFSPKRRDYSHLPLRQQIVDVPESQKLCRCCGKPLADLGCKTAGEQLEIETVVYRKIIVRKRLRRTCDCPDQPRTVTAPTPAKLLPKSRLGDSVLVHLLIEKFHLQRPTHRTLEQLRLLRLSLAPGTIVGGLKRIEPMLTPVYEAIRDNHLQSGYFQADETRWRVFTEKEGKVGHTFAAILFAWARDTQS